LWVLRGSNELYRFWSKEWLREDNAADVRLQGENFRRRTGCRATSEKAVQMKLKASLSQTLRRTDGHLLYFALLPLCFLWEGVRLAFGRLKHDAAPLTLRAWLAEANSQASIATSYALLAKSMLQ
jgi:hypothetical protein